MQKKLLLLCTMTGCLSEEPSPDELMLEDTVSEITVNNLELVTKTDGPHSTWWRSPDAHCSYNRSLWGMGSVQPSNGSILFRGLVPIQGYAEYPHGAEAAAQEDLAGTTTNWSMTTYAICGLTQPDLQLVTADSPLSSSATRTWTASCPSGKKVIGAGGTIMYANGRVKVDEIRPNETLDQVTVTASEDQDGTTNNWRVRAYAICATPPPGLVRVRAAATNAWNGTAVTATCPSEKRLLSASGGVDASNPTPMRVYEIRPSSSLTSSTVRVTTKGSASGATGEVRSYAICADG